MLFRYILSRIVVVLTFILPALGQQTPVGRTVPGRFLVAYHHGAIPSDAAARADRAGARMMQRHDRLGLAVVQTAPDNAAALRTRLVQDPAVDFVVEDRVVSAHALSVRPAITLSTAGDTLYNSPQGWAVRQVGGFGSLTQRGPWSVTTGAGGRIAILDSGVDRNHPDLAPNLVLNVSEIDQSAATGLPSACDDGTPQDQQGHGTWSASLAAGALGANTGLVTGVAPSASILNIKVLERMPSAATSAADSSGCNAGEAYGLMSWVLAGIADAVDNHADILSMSLGTLVDITTGDGAGLQVLFNRATHAAAQAGVILIAAAGNDGFSLANQRYVELPAQSRDVLAIVASTNPACAENLAPTAACVRGPVTLPYYSNFGPALEALAAPGGSYPVNADPTQNSGWIWGACSSGIPSTLSGPPVDTAHSFGCFGLGHAAYVQAMGTSASAPLAAGAAALIRAANPAWGQCNRCRRAAGFGYDIPTLPVPQVNAAAVVIAPPAPHPNHFTTTAR